MTSEEKKNWSKEYALKRRITLILKSERLGYWRICGKDTQKFHITLLNSIPADKREDLLVIVTRTYENCINSMKNMCDKERKTKLNNLHRYAEGRF